ncbi:PKD domain-containing protein [Aestuariibaculum sediminum]|uniref:PKD domain-containing protein n=1 Tax=Aestuariibaculum sediminum TaxID=2770637 RepID=A0A8J6U891_9FLAO|nr:PKD domain-containing protein [Aestuariibaculum sediminum]MBD0832995.1 PKD domain-containing protein [Aestuariibaculum sediminum]
MSKFYALSIAVLSTLFSCSSGGDEEEKIMPMADFEFVVDGGKVEFVNNSENADIFLWQFGDASQSQSVLDNPSFTYTRPGSYDVTVTLTATDSETGEVSMVEKVVSLADIPASIAIDGDFTDWAEIPFVDNVTGGGSLQKIKVNGSGDLISIYLEGTSDMSIYMPEWFINTDGDVATGQQMDTKFYPVSGWDIKGANPTSDFFHWTTKWNWLADAPAWWFESEIVDLGGGKFAVEMGMSKAHIEEYATLSGNGVYMAIYDWAQGWALKGSMPERESGQSPIFIEIY